MAQVPDLDPRRSLRLPVVVEVLLDHPRSKRRIDAELHDISPEGCRIVTAEPFAPGAQLVVRIGALEPWPARVVWTRDGFVGAEFHTPLSPAMVEHTSLPSSEGTKEEARPAPARRRGRTTDGAAD